MLTKEQFVKYAWIYACISVASAIISVGKIRGPISDDRMNVLGGAHKLQYTWVIFIRPYNRNNDVGLNILMLFIMTVNFYLYLHIVTL